MSLKTFHVIFIACAVIMCFGFGVWGMMNSQTGGFGAMLGGVLGFGAGIALIVYEIWFLRKLRGVSFL
jgi:hypothetical protein